MQITMDNAQIGVGNSPDGTKVMQVVDRQSGVVVIIPLTPEAARSVGTALAASVLVATGPLASAGANGHG